MSCRRAECPLPPVALTASALKRFGILCANRWRKGRQAYIVYPVIEGATEDQPELDFSHDEPEESSESTGSPARKTARKGKTAALFPCELSSR